MANYVFNPFTGALTPTPPASGLVPGIIVNADISASAAIAGTKVAPDFGSQTVITTGSALIGTATSLSTLYSGAGKLQAASNDATTIQSYAFSSTGVDYSATLELSRARNTQASPAIVVNGDYIGQINFAGYNTNFQRGATIYALVDGEPGTAGDTTDMPGKLVFATTPNGSATPTTAMTIDSSQRVGIGASAPTNQLTVKAANDDGIALTRPSNQTIQHLLISTTETGGDQYKTKFNTFNTDFVLSTYAGGGTGGNIRFRTGTAVDPTDKVVITSAGLVGIGTTAPTVPLSFSTAVGQKIDLYSDSTPGNEFGFGLQSSELRICAGTSSFIGFRTGGYSGSERARIDSSGRLLVGTSTARSNFFNTASSAPQQLQVEGTTGNTCSLSSICCVADTSGGRLLLAHQRSGAVGGNTILNSGDETGVITFQGNDGGQFVESASISAQVDGTPGADDMPGRLVFSTCPDSGSSPTERMRISANGSVQIGRTGQVNTEILALQNAGEIGYFYQTSNSNVTGITMRHTYAQSAQTAKMISFTRDNGTEVGAITSTTTATAYGTSSDYRLKENVVAVNDGIIRLQQLKPSRFNFIVDPDKTVDGFIAHEVQSVVPEAITGEKDAADDDGNPVYQGIDQSKLVPLLTAALQEAIAKIESLEARLTAAGI